MASDEPDVTAPWPGFHAVTPLRQALVVTAIVACCALVVLTLAAGPGPHEARQRLLVLLPAAGAMVALRRWPLPFVAVTAADAVLEVTRGLNAFPAFLLLSVATYLTAARLPRRHSFPAALVAAAAIGGALIWAMFEVKSAPVAVDTVEGLFPLAAAWFVGDSVAARRRYLAGLAEQAERERAAEAEEARRELREERVRIARELHDLVAHTLAVITVQAGVGRRLMARRPEEAGKALESIETIGRTAQDELRVVLGLLRDEDGASASLAPAPALNDLADLVETVRTSGIPVELRMSGVGRELSPALELSIYRVVQEALTNVVKHAPGASATVDVALSPGEVRVEVVDDAPTRPGPRGSGGHGIVGMRARVAAFGGSLVAEPLQDRGFRVLARIPIDGAA